MRASRLVSVLLLLQARGRVTAAELAEELEVSVRTVYRDVADLGAAGVPVIGERGEGGGFRLLDGYRTNLTGLTPEEASALLLAGAPAPAAELGLGSLLATTRLKLLAALPSRLRGMATRAEERFHMDPGGWAHQRPRDPRHLRTVAQAVWQDQQVRISYERGDGRVVQRTLHPLGCVHKTGTWYLVATDGGDPRVYRVDRVRAAVQIAADVTRPAGFDLVAFWADWEAQYAATLPTFDAEVRLGPLAQRHLDRLGALAPRRTSDLGVDGDGWARRALTFDDQRIATAALLALSPDVEVVDPPALREALAAAAREVLARCAAPSRAAAQRAGRP